MIETRPTLRTSYQDRINRKITRSEWDMDQCTDIMIIKSDAKVNRLMSSQLHVHSYRHLDILTENQFL